MTRPISSTSCASTSSNGCSTCVDGGRHHAHKSGEIDDRMFAVTAWREMPYFTDPVPDDIWNEAAKHYDEKTLSGLLLQIALVNVWNRLNVTTRQPAGQRW